MNSFCSNENIKSLQYGELLFIQFMYADINKAKAHSRNQHNGQLYLTYFYSN